MKGTHCRALTGGLIACLLTLLLSVTASAAETVASGDCGGEGDGTNLTWTLDSEGTLTIRGSGKMADWRNNYWAAPWQDQSETIYSVVIGDGVTSIGDRAFSGCSSLMSVTLPDGVTEIGSHTFAVCPSLTSITIPDSVTSIGDYTFSGCSSLTSITLPDGMMYIGGAVFRGCSSLTNVTFPDSLISIGDYAFCECSGLTSITIPDGVTDIGYCTFSGCSSLMSITIPSGVTSIGGYAFRDCTSLTSVTIPSSVTSIGDYAFRRCLSLTSITIPDSVTSIGSSAFQYCSRLITVDITGESRLTSIGGHTFDACYSLTSITIPDSVTSIGDYAFGFCFSLTSITIPSSVTSIGEGAFYMCSNLTNVHITDVGAWCRIAFADNTANPLCCAKTLFVNGAKAEALEIPADVKVIPVNAFINAECIKRVALPKDLQGIAANAFSGCTGIEKVFYAGSESEWKALPIGAGNDCLKNAQIHYDSTLDDYYCRITVKVSDGGRIRVDRNTAAAGETVTVSAEPYAGYELTAIYVDGQKLEEGNTFTVRGNHEVSAEFTLLPVYGGTAEYRLEGITVCTAAGEKRQELTREKLLVSVQIRHMAGDSGATVMLAQYDAQGRYQGLMWLTVDEMPQGTALRATLPLDNSDGRAANLKAFVVSSVTASAPIGNAVSFGDV